MGLDLIAEGCAKPGHEAEWRRMVDRAFDEDELSEEELARFGEISISAYAQLGAPRVGQDAAADAWIIKARGATTTEEIAQVVKDFDGHHVLALVESDGVPEQSHGGLYDGLDETSFRGSALTACRDVLQKDLINAAWEHKLPEAAVVYGRGLLAAAAAATAPGFTPPKPGLLARLGLGGGRPTLPLGEQIKIVEAAGRWFVFWGERGHPIRAWS